LANLNQFAVVIFSNTSGNNILTAAQRANFEAYINSGGSYLGIHAASDTYRHSSANGGLTGTWDWYSELVGASVQTAPNHVTGTPNYDMTKIGTHPTTENIPNPWSKNEEYYYWLNGYYNTSNNVVLEVEETVGPNGNVNNYDAARPTAWTRDLTGGGRMFYTSLGHANSNYTSDQDFQDLIRDAIIWTADQTIVQAIQLPFLGSPQDIPGVIEAEWYDEGGQDVAYNDNGIHQGGSLFRNDEGLDVVDKPTASNELAVGFTSANEWTEYTVDVEPGVYNITLRYAANTNAIGTVRLTLDGVTIALYDQLTSTGGWTVFSDVTLSGINLTGAQDAILRIAIEGLGGLDYDAVTFSSDGPTCEGDLDGNGVVNVQDFLIINSTFGQECE